MFQKLDFMECLVLRRVQEAMAAIADSRVEIWSIGEGEVEFYINCRQVNAYFSYISCPNHREDHLELQIGPHRIHYRVTFGEQGACYLSGPQAPFPLSQTALGYTLWNVRNSRNT